MSTPRFYIGGDITDSAGTRRLSIVPGGTAGTTTTLSTTATVSRNVTLPDATDTLVGLATADTLTNKNITGATNTVEADALKTTGASVTLSAAAPPSVGQVVTATSATTAAWSTPAGGSNVITYTGTSILDGSNANLLPGVQTATLFSGTDAYHVPCPTAMTFSAFEYSFSRPIDVGETINVRLIVNGAPVAALDTGVWGADFNSLAPQSGTIVIATALAVGDKWDILVNSFAVTGPTPFYLNWSLLAS